MRKLVFLFTVLVISIFCDGCSVFMAARQPDKKDLQLLNTGTPRPQVLAELGTPIKTCIENDQLSDTYVFRQGYGKGARWARGVLHGTADILTLGLWEMVGTPIELIADGDDVELNVFYDQGQRVTYIRVKKGIGVLEGVNSITDKTPEPSVPDIYSRGLVDRAVEKKEMVLPELAESTSNQSLDKNPTVGVVSQYADEVSSPNIRRQWLSKATGIGDWYTDPQTARNVRGTLYGSGENYSALRELFVGSLLYYPAVVAAGAYTVVYLPFAATTGAVAGEIDSYEWRACKEPFLNKIHEADPANEFVQAVTSRMANFIRIENSGDLLGTASAIDLKRVLQFEIKEIGLATCNALGRFSLQITSQARLWNVETKEISFENSYSKTSGACMKIEAYCGHESTDFLKTEVALLVQGIAENVISGINQYLE